jgi:hypothetical protein
MAPSPMSPRNRLKLSHAQSPAHRPPAVRPVLNGRFGAGALPGSPNEFGITRHLVMKTPLNWQEYDVSPEEEELPPGGVPLGDPVWEPWAPAHVAALLRGVTVPWCVAAGWALDLFRGEQTREHEDIEIAVPNTAEAFGQVRAALAGYDFEVPGGPPPGWLWPVDGPAFAVMHQTWVSEVSSSDTDSGPSRIYRLDVFREPQRDGEWVCRRDESITLPYDQIIRRDGAGIPYLAPQIVLLFKAKAARAKDQADLAGALPLLTPDERSWLATTLRRVHPGHEWLAQLYL